MERYTRGHSRRERDMVIYCTSERWSFTVLPVGTLSITECTSGFLRAEDDKIKNFLDIKSAKSKNTTYVRHGPTIEVLGTRI